MSIPLLAQRRRDNALAFAFAFRSVLIHKELFPGLVFFGKCALCCEHSCPKHPQTPHFGASGGVLGVFGDILECFGVSGAGWACSEAKGHAKREVRQTFYRWCQPDVYNYLRVYKYLDRVCIISLNWSTS